MRTFAMISCLLLAGCEATSFQASPVAEGACDSELAGTWLSVDEKSNGKDDGEVELRIDAACQLLFVENEKAGRKEGTPTQLYVGRDSDARYLWVDADWAKQRFEMKDTSAPSGDIYLLRYSVANQTLTLELPDDRAVAHRIIDGKLRGETHKTENTLTNRLLAPVDAAALREAGFFDDDRGVLRKAPAKK
ncbi:hypothetical protein [Arenimonas sp.]|uniref:hypothetical protein n=1 Tax=Arenimonas sp. TaxID=1872635 RepID=UPI0039E4FC71